MTVIIIIVSLVLGAFNYEPWWLDTNPQYQKDNHSKQDKKVKKENAV